MKTRQILLASAAVAGLSLVNAAAASANQWYVSVAGGANWLGDDSFSLATSGPTNTFNFFNDPSTGFVFTGAVGMGLGQYMNGLRGEVELAYRENNVRGTWFSTSTNGSGSGALDYQHSTFSVMANVWYDFQVAGLNPYIGGGIGWANSEADGTFSSTGSLPLDGSESGFAWQLGAGLSLDIQPGLKADLGYRYFQGPDVSIPGPYFPTNPIVGEVNEENHSVTVGLRVEM